METILNVVFDKLFNFQAYKRAKPPKVDAMDFVMECEDYFWTVCNHEDLKSDKECKQLYNKIKKYKKTAQKVEKLRKKVLIGK